MNAEKQIFAYKELRNNGQAFFIDNYEDADRIIEALEKQIPIKPIGNTNICPKCQDVEFGFNEPKYCPNCGQAIKWE